MVSLVACQSLSPLQPTLAIGRAWPSASGPRALWWWWLLPWCCNPTLALNVGWPWCVHGFEPQHCFRFQLTSQMQLAGSANAPGYCCAKLTLMLLPATRLAIRFLCARMNACHAQLWRRVSRLIDWACVRACGVVWCGVVCQPAGRRAAGGPFIVDLALIRVQVQGSAAGGRNKQTQAVRPWSWSWPWLGDFGRHPGRRTWTSPSPSPSRQGATAVPPVSGHALRRAAAGMFHPSTLRCWLEAQQKQNRLCVCVCVWSSGHSQWQWQWQWQYQYQLTAMDWHWHWHWQHQTRGCHRSASDIQPRRHAADTPVTVTWSPICRAHHLASCFR